MASVWRKAMLYLGLGPDEEYDDYGVVEEQHRQAPRASPGARRPPADAGGSADAGAGPARPVRTLPTPAGDSELHTNGNGARHGEDGTPPPTRAARSPDRSGRPRTTQAPVVRPMVAGPAAKPHVVGPASFDDAQEIADKFKINVPVILNLQDVDRDLSRRIIDFASGLCYGLSGQMERVANQVYLLTPSDVEVSAEERRRLQERGYEA